MDKPDIRLLHEAAESFMPGLKVIPIAGVNTTVDMELPFLDKDGKRMYFFVGKREKTHYFAMLIPVESTGLIASTSTLEMLQPMLKTYGLQLSQEAVIMEENSELPLDQRMGAMVQALLGIDGIRRLWQVDHDRRTNAESKDSEPISDSPDSSTPR